MKMVQENPELGSRRSLLAIVEQGGYPDFTSLYQQHGYNVRMENSMRKVLGLLKKRPPDVIVAEFNFQPAFRDRLSNLESLIAATQRQPDIKMIIFYDREFHQKLQQLEQRYAFFATLPFPVDEQELSEVMRRAAI